jgi:hypothetical protein
MYKSMTQIINVLQYIWPRILVHIALIQYLFLSIVEYPQYLHKRDDFIFPMVNVPFISSNIPAALL